MVSNKEAIRAFANVLRFTPGTDNLPPQPAIFANGWGPIVRATDDGSRELARVRWGLPTPPDKLKGNADTGVRNLRNLWFWKDDLDVLDRRCVVPATSFCEPDQVGGSNANYWFALNDERPLFFFAGVWRPQWTSVRKVKDGPTTDDLYAFLTTDANTEVAEVHNKAMPVILRTPEEVERWFTIPGAVIKKEMQKPLPNGTLKVVSIGPKMDGVGTPIGEATEAPAQASLF